MREGWPPADVFTYDPSTDRMNQYQFNVNSQSDKGAVGWNPNGTLGSLSITDQLNSGDTQTCNYNHDDLVRIASANCGMPWSQTFSYSADTTGAFGNLSKSGTSSFQPTYSYQTNRMTQVGSSTRSYDANGNALNDTSNTYTWDANSRPVTVNSVGLTYDALGRMVEQNRSGTYTQIVYDAMSTRLALMSAQSLQKAFVPLAGGSMAVYNSNGLAYYRHSDWLGSSRLASTPSRGVYSSTAYAPFGEPYASSGTADPSFTGMNQDTSPNIYDFPAREYNSIHVRWPSPDPAGLAAVDLTDPQTFNRYAYVRNSPLQSVDPSGLDPCDDDGGCLDNSDPCPIEICGPDLFDPYFIDDGSAGGVPPAGFAGPTGPPIPLPGQQLPSSTPSTFPTGPGVDWTSILFGPPNQSLLIFNGVCVNSSGAHISCSLPGAIDCTTQENANVNGCQAAFFTIPVGSAAVSDKPRNTTCTDNAVNNGILHAGIDAIGLIPEGGLISRAVGKFAGWRGIVATQQGTKAIRAIKTGSGISSTGMGGGDTSPEGKVSTGLGVLGFIPGVGTAASALSVGFDVFRTAKEVRNCP